MNEALGYMLYTLVTLFGILAVTVIIGGIAEFLRTWNERRGQ